MAKTRCLCILCAALAGALALLYLTAAATPSAAQAPPAKPQAAGAKQVSFINEVAPILQEYCFGCHGAKNPKGKLDMTHYESLRKGGTKDDPIAPGKPDDSYLIEVLHATGKKRMPPEESGDALPKEQVAVLT